MEDAWLCSYIACHPRELPPQRVVPRAFRGERFTALCTGKIVYGDKALGEELQRIGRERGEVVSRSLPYRRSRSQKARADCIERLESLREIRFQGGDSVEASLALLRLLASVLSLYELDNNVAADRPRELLETIRLKNKRAALLLEDIRKLPLGSAVGDISRLDELISHLVEDNLFDATFY